MIRGQFLELFLENKANPQGASIDGSSDKKSRPITLQVCVPRTRLEKRRNMIVSYIQEREGI